MVIAGNRGAAQGQSGRARDRDHERRARQRLRLAAQHEPARGQALVLRRVQLHPRRPRPAAVPRATRRCRPTRPRRRSSSCRRSCAGIVSGRPIQPAELDRAKASLTLTLPGSWETIGAVAGTIGEIVAFGLDDRYFDTYADKVRAQTRRERHRAPPRAHGPAGPARLGHRGRPRQDRARAPRARPGRDPPGGRRRQSRVPTSVDHRARPVARAITRPRVLVAINAPPGSSAHSRHGEP